jgi:hypothetical protein
MQCQGMKEHTEVIVRVARLSWLGNQLFHILKRNFLLSDVKLTNEQHRTS